MSYDLDELTEDERYVYDHPGVAPIEHARIMKKLTRNVDPTRIDIRFDPTEQRMRGYAMHGNTPFDVPFISEVRPDLWQGGVEAGLILPDHIQHVVSLYPWEKYRRDHGTYREFRMYDSLDGLPPRDELDAIADYVNKQRFSGTTLVHCQAGLNRSGLVAAIALIRSEGITGAEAISQLRECRSPAVLCNTAFESYVLDYT